MRNELNYPGQTDSTVCHSSIDEMIARFALALPKENGTEIGATELNEELKNKGRFIEPELSDECLDKIIELKAIAEGIGEKIIEHAPFTEKPEFKIKYQKELNHQQLTAVTTTDRPMLVIAGAGSGKTRVITYKVAYLIENGVPPSEILLLTFTRKAADEMLGRVESLLTETAVGNVLGGTFHRFANYALRRWAYLIGIPNNFTIIDTEDTADIIDLVKKELGITGMKDGPAFPRKGKIQKIISRARNLERSVKDVITEFFDENLDYVEEIEILDQAQQKYKAMSNLLDYDDLMLVLRDKLRDNEEFRSRIQQSIKYVLVDEYQDTNNAQREIVELLAGENGKVTVVGDDSQSIYGFRGANFENILRFPQSFPSCGIVMMEQNYRSDQGILNFCNDVISNARLGFKKKLFAERDTGKKPIVRRFADGQDEAEFIVDTMLELRENELDYEDFAVLTRASWHSNYVQAELQKRGIPYIVVGGIKFSERRHVKDLMAMIKITENSLDALSWHRILKLIEGIGEFKAREIVDQIHQNKGVIELSRFSKRMYYPELERLQATLNQVIEGNFTVSRTVEIMINYYKPILKQIEDDYASRNKDLDIFAIIAGKYDDMRKFLTDFALDPPSNRYQDENTPMTEPDEKPMVISTIHSAKGLEWHTVFLPFALDGLIPSIKALETIEKLEEERRLFYVACSRAMENLYITMPAYVPVYGAVFTLPTRFLYDVEESHYEVLN
ncbi:MAG: ATP-dependent helicase [Bacteroidales bacterium]|nr:ATP-dependent helicase [Bacteroidales bacterium]